MGYVSRNIANITEPKIVTLAATPNFVEFASSTTGKTFLEYNVQVNIGPGAEDIEELTLLRFTEPSGTVHAFHGVDNPDDVGGSAYYISTIESETAENLRGALLANRWIKANFEIKIPFAWSGSTPTNGKVLNIKSKGAGIEFNVDITAPNNTGNAAYTITAVNATSYNNDSISGENVTAEIELDVYVDANVFLGQNDVPNTNDKIGTYAVTLQKTYGGVPLWFELNTLFAQYAAFNRPLGAYGWFNTGTARTYRFIAKKRALNSFSFYQSNALFVINGYGYPSEELDLTPYVYNNNTIKLLTNKPRTTYTRGQKEYLNFLFSDPNRGTGSPSDYSVRPVYKVYSPSDTVLGTQYGPAINRGSLSIVNTCALDMDALLDLYPTAGILRVGLARGEAEISDFIEYQVRPDCLHILNQVTFLNRLGGWDTFNFDAVDRIESKPDSETYQKTVTPAYTRGESIETVLSTSLEKTITIEGAPVTDEVADWLLELSAARVVLDGEGNYLIKEDFTIPKNETGVNMRIPTIKYRLSENFTND